MQVGFESSEMIERFASTTNKNELKLGAVADVVSQTTIYPLEVIKTKIQADPSLRVGDLLHEPFSLYVGLSTKVLTSVQQKFQYFYCYAVLKSIYQGEAPTKRKIGVVADLLLGYFAALEGLVTTLPLSVTNTRMIANHKTAEEKGFLATFQNSWKTDGFLKFYQSVGPNAILCINPAITYMIFEQIKKRVLRGSDKLVMTAFQGFVVGAVSKMIASTVTFPLMRIRVLIQTWKKQRDKYGVTNPRFRENPTTLSVLRLVLEREGLGGLYLGLPPTLVKGVANASLMLAVKEPIYAIINNLMA